MQRFYEWRTRHLLKREHVIAGLKHTSVVETADQNTIISVDTLKLKEMEEQPNAAAPDHKETDTGELLTRFAQVRLLQDCKMIASRQPLFALRSAQGYVVNKVRAVTADRRTCKVMDLWSHLKTELV
jgi:hypothetical protein